MTQHVFVDETTPTARALLVLEMVQNSPGIRGEQLANRLGMTDRAVRRYVGNLRDAGIAVESTRGKYGGYRIGRGVRLRGDDGAVGDPGGLDELRLGHAVDGRGGGVLIR